MDSEELQTLVKVDLKHMLQEPGNNVVAMGIDLTEFYLRHQRLEIQLTYTQRSETLKAIGGYLQFEPVVSL